MGKRLKVLSLVLLFCAGLIAGCSDENGTSVNPADLDAMTNGFTEGSGDVDAMVVEGLLKASPYMAMGDGMMPSPKISIKSSPEAFNKAFEQLNKLPVPYLNEIMNMIMTYAITGKPFDKTGTVAKMLGDSLKFRSLNPKITIDMLASGAPDCIYIDGLPASIETLIILIASGGSPTEGMITAALEDLADMIKNFDITIGAEGEGGVCEFDPENPGAMNLKGSINIKGSVNIETDNFSANVTVTANDVEFNQMTDADNNMKITGSGSLGFNTETALNAEGFDFDFLFWINSLAVDVTGEELATPFTFGGSVNGALAFNIVADSVAFEDFSLPSLATIELPFDTPEYLPDICNMILTLVIDFDVTLDLDPTVDNAALEIPIFFGAKIEMENDNTAGMCFDPTGTIVYVYFYSADQYYVVTVDSPASLDCTIGTWDFSMNVTGSEGKNILLCIDVPTSCDVVIPDGSTVTDFDCTWPADWPPSLP